MLTGITLFDCALHRLIHKSFVTTAHRAGERRGLEFSGYRSLVLLDFSLTVRAATVIFIPGRGSAISSAKEGKSSFIYNLVKS